MSRRPRRARPALVVATVLAGLLALAGCSAGAVTQTDTTITGVSGAMGRSADGNMTVLDLSIDPGQAEVVPAGATVALRGSMVNDGQFGDRLLSVSTPYAGAANATGQTAVPGDNATRIIGSEPGPVGPPVQGSRTTGTARVLLTGVTQVLHSGPTYELTMTFERAGTITVPVPVLGQNRVPVS